MRIAISNLAWDPTDDENVASLLNRYSVDAIEAVPTKYFSDPAKANDTDIARVRAWWNARGIEIASMQTLLYGTSGLNLFGPDNVQSDMLDFLKAICNIARGLGATRLVFGSPKNRDRTGLTNEQADEIAVKFFLKLGDIANRYGVVFCLEPNPPCYGSNFMINSEETARMVEKISHEAIRMQLDTGAITINEENLQEAIIKNAHLFGHIHASEPALVPLGQGKTDHAKIGALIADQFPDKIVSIETLATKDVPHLESIEGSLKRAIACYKHPNDLDETKTL